MLLYKCLQECLYMNKADLVDSLSAESGLSKTDSERALAAFLAVVTKALKKGEDVTLIGFGSFSVKKSAEGRSGRNFKTGEAITIVPKNSVKFKAGKVLKDAVNDAE